MNTKMIWLVLVALVVILWLVFYLASRYNPSRLQINDLTEIGAQVSGHAGYMLPPYQIVEVSSGGSKTIFRPGSLPLIELQIVDQHGNYFSSQTLIIVFIHELVHILNPNEKGHGKVFLHHEGKLLDSAITLGIISQEITIDPQYPQESQHASSQNP